MSAANISGFSSLPAGIKDFLYYRHCRHFPMLLDLPDKCGGVDKSADIFLLLVIKSSPVNYERREVLRKTWAKERSHNGVWIRRIFISGTMDSGFEKKRLNKLLELEQREYNDILQWDFSDTFYNLTLKQILFLEWMERNCPKARFLLNGDDDVFANTDNMVDYLQSLKDNDGSKHLFAGHLIQNVGPIRSSGSKYFIPAQAHLPAKPARQLFFLESPLQSFLLDDYPSPQPQPQSVTIITDCVEDKLFTLPVCLVSAFGFSIDL
ncbi:N-acetyllactosaminide beta-1,3-N-acetylglucosaminyltransferase 3-like isoform X1 [Lates japonicus]|uniref:Hexosyltransferase n=1 Tax=Lates japonicus TaxID=270547 RepID=A0AAD3MAD3_LATJO|nr:N-acetyllactosaminide beta-1,3-N-acetylglucosaminyltransferase 3-like isoform X1 [Lates japonicus]